MELINILTTSEYEKWNFYLKQIPYGTQDIFYTPEYYKIYENNGDGKAYCFVLNDSRNTILYPYLLNKINDLGYILNKTYYDIQGAYGYNGVLSSTDDQSFINNFNAAFSEYCIDNDIIAEFTRFNPIIKNELFSKNYLDIKFNRKTVYVDLKDDYSEIYKNFASSVKSNIKKAISNNLSVKIFQNTFPCKMSFIEMYEKTMKRVNSSQYLLFNREYFEDTFRELKVIHFVEFKENIPIASAICLSHNKYLHVHFEASNIEYQQLRPNDLLIDDIIKFGIENEYSILHLGGGRTTNGDDALLRFKKKFSIKNLDFFTGMKIYNEQVYNNVCNQWEEKYPGLTNKYKNYLLKYRYTDEENIFKGNIDLISQSQNCGIKSSEQKIK